eukprot:ANDGO_06981.mRNA.1 hypothetical protein
MPQYSNSSFDHPQARFASATNHVDPRQTVTGQQSHQQQLAASIPMSVVMDPSAIVADISKAHESVKSFLIEEMKGKEERSQAQEQVVQELRTRVHDLEKKLSDAHAISEGVNSLSEMLHDLEAHVEELEMEKQESSRIARTERERADHAEREVGQLKSQLQETMNKQQAAEGALKVLEAQNSQLVSACRETQYALDKTDADLADEISRLSTERNSMYDALMRLSEDEKKSREQCEDAEQKVINLEDKCSAERILRQGLEDTLKVSQKAASDARSEWEREREQLRKEADTLKQQFQQVSDEAKKWKIAKQVTDEEKDVVIQMLHREKHNLEQKLDTEVREHEEALVILERKYKGKESEQLSSLSNELRDVMERLRVLSAALQEKDVEVLRLSEVEKQYASLIQENANLKHQLLVFEKEHELSTSAKQARNRSPTKMPVGSGSRHSAPSLSSSRKSVSPSRRSHNVVFRDNDDVVLDADVFDDDDDGGDGDGGGGADKDASVRAERDHFVERTMDSGEFDDSPNEAAKLYYAVARKKAVRDRQVQEKIQGLSTDLRRLRGRMEAELQVERELYENKLEERDRELSRQRDHILILTQQLSRLQRDQALSLGSSTGSTSSFSTIAPGPYYQSPLRTSRYIMSSRP